MRQKAKGHPKDKTLEKRFYGLGNTSMTTCICQGTELTKEKEASSFYQSSIERYSADPGNYRIHPKYFVSK